jgi:RNA polymerase sigma-70 factor (ECF subfamily)
VERFSDALYRFTLKSLRDSEEARDIVQESFLRLWENRAAVIEGKEKSYLFTIAYRLLIDRVRLSKRYAGEQALQYRAGGIGSEYSGLDEVLSAALETLNETQRNLVLLRDYEGYSYREIGQITGLTESQVKVYIFRARGVLKQKIGVLEEVI